MDNEENNEIDFNEVNPLRVENIHTPDMDNEEKDEINFSEVNPFQVENNHTPDTVNEENNEIDFNEVNPLRVENNHTTDKGSEETDAIDLSAVKPRHVEINHMPEWYVEKNPRIRSEIFSWVRTIAIGVIVGVLLVVFVVQRDNVYGGSMEPTLYDGDVVFTQKITTYTKGYDRGDIVILDGENMDGYNHEEYLIKRIIGLPGETVRIADGKVLIKKPGEENYIAIVEDYLAEGTITSITPRGYELGYGEITLGDNEYYCLGDNREISNDSRNLGPFTSDRIKGVAFVIFYPFARFGFI